MEEINYKIDEMSIDDNIELLFKSYLNKNLKLSKIELAGIYNTSAFPFSIAIEKLKTFKIIEENKNDEYILQYEGYEVLKLGGWKKYLENLVKQKAEQNEMVQSVISTNKNQRIVSFVTLVFSAVALIISILTYIKKDDMIVKDIVKVDILNKTDSTKRTISK